MRFFGFLATMVWATVAHAGPPVIENVVVSSNGDTARFDVTIRHADTGWDHYADGWGVYDLDGQELGYRVLHHPHVNEQPFTRSLSVDLPAGTSQVVIVPRDSVHGTGEPVQVEITK